MADVEEQAAAGLLDDGPGDLGTAREAQPPPRRVALVLGDHALGPEPLDHGAHVADQRLGHALDVGRPLAVFRDVRVVGDERRQVDVDEGCAGHRRSDSIRLQSAGPFVSQSKAVPEPRPAARPKWT